MKKIFFYLSLCLMAGGMRAQNPIVSHCYTADPAPVAFEGEDSLYVYCDEDMNVPGVHDFYYMNRWRVYSTVDMVNWTDHGIAMPREAFSWGKDGTCWASQCIKKGQYYYWYMCLSKPGDWRHYIGVGYSKKPSGPFKDPIKKPLFDTGEGGDIDPTVFIDDDGKAYLYWGNNKLRYARLTSVMMGVDTRIGKNGVVEVPLTKEAFGGVKVKEGDKEVIDGVDCYEEGPWLFKRGDNYYLMYSAGGVPEHISYSMSKSPTGPWEYKGKVMSQDNNTGSFTNHSGMVHYQGKDYFFYHTGWAKGGGGFNRSMAVEEMYFNADGTIKPVTATRKGVKALRAMDPYVRQQAETLNAAYGISVVGDESKGVYVTDIQANDSMRVANVDFGTEGARSFTVRVASTGGNGSLIVRQDNARGRILGKFKIEKTGGDDIWEERTFDLTQTPSGVHDVYFSFSGVDSNTLFNWDWWQFNAVPSAVEHVEASPRSDSSFFYTLQGTPVENPTRGVYIKNGRKILVK